ncbi:MAG: hypothetical protein H0X18_03620 [Geodermatophilaceae bacterium]|nr:hypothetical protein [Geodermatophilaceae bacterium]
MCGIDNDREWNDYAAHVRQARRNAGQPLTRWSPAHLVAALDLTVRGRGWPPEQAAVALLAVASDPATRSPARLAEPGPWWDGHDKAAANGAGVGEAVDSAALERELDAVDGLRAHLQQQARHELTIRSLPVTRTAVLARAVELLHEASTDLCH